MPETYAEKKKSEPYDWARDTRQKVANACYGHRANSKVSRRRRAAQAGVPRHSRHGIAARRDARARARAGAAAIRRPRARAPVRMHACTGYDAVCRRGVAS
eukprot:COSAG02_NODE_2536_length_8579_cov_4.816863_2_plen_101_part_00